MKVKSSIFMQNLRADKCIFHLPSHFIHPKSEGKEAGLCRDHTWTLRFLGCSGMDCSTQEGLTGLQVAQGPPSGSLGRAEVTEVA